MIKQTKASEKMKKIITCFLFLMCAPSVALFAQQEKPVIINTWYELNLEQPLNLPLKSFFLNDLESYGRSFFYPSSRLYLTEKLAMECIEKEEYKRLWTDEERENGEWQEIETIKRCQENVISDYDLASALGFMQFPIFILIQKYKPKLKNLKK
ncbi:MAG: hypothetical protein EAZ08_07460 [Cytophagales bacterium]|nr:MAG: hypothetical protein EAZ08_07460 [Cytophagales bacterium]